MSPIPLERPTRTGLALLALAVSVAVGPAAPAAAQRPGAFETAWRGLMRQQDATLEETGIVGASFMFVRDGGIAARHTWGAADLAAGRPVDDATIFHWASITKTFTAVAIMQLRDRGLLDLDDPIVDYVPELREVYNPFGPMEQITIRQLMSHSAGFRAPTWPWGGGEDWQPYEPTEWSQLVAMMPYTRILFQPGSRFSYSNPGIIFLGRVIEKVTGDVFEAYIEKNIFRPLGMRHAYFDNTPWHLLPYRSNNYHVESGRPVANGLDFNTGITVSNGGLNAPLDDMATWLGFLTGAPADRQATYGMVLERSSLEEMWQEVVPTGETEPLGREAMGLCFFLYDVGGRRLIGHTGSQRGFRAFILFDPERRAGMIANYNTADGDDTAPPTRRILDELRGKAARELFQR